MFAFSGERSTHFLFQIARMIILFTLSIFHRLFIENNLSHALGVSKSLLDEKLSSQSFPQRKKVQSEKQKNLLLHPNRLHEYKLPRRNNGFLESNKPAHAFLIEFMSKLTDHGEFKRFAAISSILQCRELIDFSTNFNL